MSQIVKDLERTLSGRDVVTFIIVDGYRTNSGTCRIEELGGKLDL